MGAALGDCCCRDDDDIEGQLMELKDQVQMWRACAQGHELEKRSISEQRQRGNIEKLELRLQAADLEAKLNDLSERYRQSVNMNMRGLVTQARLTRKASFLGHENDRSARGTALAIQTLGPLQSSINQGDASGLQEVITTLTPRMVKLDENDEGRELGELASIVKSLYQDAVKKSWNWRGILKQMQAVVDTLETGKISRRDIKRLFCTLKEGSLMGLSVHMSSPELIKQMERAFFDYFVGDGACGNRVQREIIHRILRSHSLRDLDFTDMSQCVSLVDLDETPTNEFFLEHAEACIEGHEVAEFKHILTSLDTVVFFLRFLDREDLGLTYKRYRSLQHEAWVAEYLRLAEAQYGPGRELVQTAGLNLHCEEHVMGVLEQLKSSPPNASSFVRGLRTIFFSWARIMKDKFNILVLPHHVQVVCLLMCLQYIAGPTRPEVGALIAEVGTGEGKSALIASLAVYCVVYLGKRVHVVVDDETLVERDFFTYRSLFTAFSNRYGRPLRTELCVSGSRKRSHFARDECAAVRMDEDADIVYCEAKHLQSFYTHLAKRGGVDFDQVYKDRVLILDEVDALVINEAPNVPFVYENAELTAFATKIANCLVHSVPPEQIAAMATSPMQKQVVRNMERAVQSAGKWILNTDYALDKDTNKYVRLQDGRATTNSWSLALEFKNYMDRFSEKVSYNERLFIMSRPRVFRKYERIIGLSGSVGNTTERAYLNTVYNARFFKVPKFLTTCRGSSATYAEPRGIVIEADEDSQWRTTCDRAFAYRETTPVLIIARDRHSATRLAEELSCIANAKGFNGKDIVCSLSRDLSESHPDQFKENFFRCTQPIGKGACKAFRIAVTDPRGGRGMDYRVSDPDADRNGGLTLIINHIPKCCRDWTQYLGRTARQDCRGQWLAVLNRRDYAEDEQRSGQVLQPQTAVETILSWGNADTSSRLQKEHSQYHRGMRMNELSEEMARHKLLASLKGREVMVRLCSEYQRMSIAQIDKMAMQVPGLVPSQIPTLAMEVDTEANVQASVSANRSIIFLIDRSSSMLSQDAGGKTRFDVCKECILDIFEKKMEDQDEIGVYTFASQVHESLPLMNKGPNREAIASALQQLPAPHGLTRMHDGVSECLQRLRQGGRGQKYLVTLTDGDDNQSVQQPNGEQVTAALRAGIKDLSLIFVTCGGDIKPRTLELVRYWVQLAQNVGNASAHISARNPAQLRDAFTAVAEFIDEPEGDLEI